MTQLQTSRFFQYQLKKYAPPRPTIPEYLQLTFQQQKMLGTKDTDELKVSSSKKVPQKGLGSRYSLVIVVPRTRAGRLRNSGSIPHRGKTFFSSS
jgi:hypothetical protein